MNSSRSVSIVVAAIALGCGGMLAIFWPRGTYTIESTASSAVAPAPQSTEDGMEPRACDALNGITTSCVYG